MKKYLGQMIALIVALLFSLTVVAGPVMAAEMMQEKPTPSADAMIFDTVFMRPLGLVSSVFGGAVFVLSLPFTIANDSTRAAGEKLVADPLRYTFQRPLGQFE